MQYYVVITERCNLNCKMCIRGNASERDMAFSDFVSISRDEQFRSGNIVVTGGEPVLHPQFCDIVYLCCELSNSVCVATNGTLDYYVDDLCGIENLCFQVSLDGNKETHNAIRNGDCFDSLFATITKYEKRNIVYNIASTIGKENKETIFDLVPLLKDRKLQYWKVSCELPFGRNHGGNLMRAEEWNDFVDRLLSVVNFPLHIKKIFDFGLYDRLERKNQMPTINRCFNCGSGNGKLYIYPDQNVYPCTCLTDFSLGNLKKNSMTDILNGEKIKKFQNIKPCGNTPCRDCRYVIYCNGGCLGMSYDTFGELGKGDVRCPILRNHYEQKGILF